MKHFLIISLLANALLSIGLYQYVSSYDLLLTWACENGNGGYECGEN
jgi:hypothetical protein